MKAGADKIRLTHRLANVLRTRIAEPTVQLLKQGVTPRAIAASMATGAVIGIFPVLGTTTAICLAVALLLRLNLVAIQILNWLVYPLQVLLIIPFIDLGQRLFSDTRVVLSLVEIQSAFAQGWVQAIGRFWGLMLNGVFAWAIVSVPVGIVVYLVLVVVLQRAGICAQGAQARQ
jgi:uncharacterized protein (DUF2062 family)